MNKKIIMVCEAINELAKMVVLISPIIFGAILLTNIAVSPEIDATNRAWMVFAFIFIYAYSFNNFIQRTER